MNSYVTSPALRVRVKICGITREQDAITAVNLGADAIGLVFYSESPRVVSVDQAKKITAVIPPFVSKVGLFVDVSDVEIEAVLNQVPLDILQFHGSEKPEQCQNYSTPYIKAVRMHKEIDLGKIVCNYSDASALLLDTYIEGQYGGTGKAFDWSMIPDDLGLPIILAGGLTAANVADAIKQVSPYAVDVSGGVESAKGIKDHKKIEEFINEVTHAKY